MDDDGASTSSDGRRRARSSASSSVMTARSRRAPPRALAPSASLPPALARTHASSSSSVNSEQQQQQQQLGGRHGYTATLYSTAASRPRSRHESSGPPGPSSSSSRGSTPATATASESLARAIRRADEVLLANKDAEETEDGSATVRERHRASSRTSTAADVAAAGAHESASNGATQSAAVSLRYQNSTIASSSAQNTDDVPTAARAPQQQQDGHAGARKRARAPEDEEALHLGESRSASEATPATSQPPAGWFSSWRRAPPPPPRPTAESMPEMAPRTTSRQKTSSRMPLPASMLSQPQLPSATIASASTSHDTPMDVDPSTPAAEPRQSEGAPTPRATSASPVARTGEAPSQSPRKGVAGDDKPRTLRPQRSWFFASPAKSSPTPSASAELPAASASMGAELQENALAPPAPLEQQPAAALPSASTPPLHASSASAGSSWWFWSRGGGADVNERPPQSNTTQHARTSSEPVSEASVAPRDFAMSSAPMPAQAAASPTRQHVPQSSSRSVISEADSVSIASASTPAPAPHRAHHHPKQQSSASWLGSVVWGSGSRPSSSAPPRANNDHDEPASMQQSAPIEAAEDTSRAPSMDSERHEPAAAVGAPVANAAEEQTLRRKSSWFFFGSGDAGAPHAGAVPAASAASPPRQDLAGMLKGPKPQALAADSSRASSRSRADSESIKSPQLGPQADKGTLKPLTGNAPAPGSVRSTNSSKRRQQPYAPPPPPPSNLVLPSFADTFERPPRSWAPRVGTLTRAVSAVTSYFFQQPPPLALVSDGQERHHHRKHDPAERLPKAFSALGRPEHRHQVTRVVTIGIHGWFPHAILTSVIGQPTGTSRRFASAMHDAVQTYLEQHDVESFNIQAIALEGEGQVDDRVRRLYGQLRDNDGWLASLRRADMVFLATHSQGSIVSTHLLAKMLEDGLMRDGAKVHMLAMCGLSQGPFVYLQKSIALQPYFNYIETQSARELFEFQDPESAVSKAFLQSLHQVLERGVKLTAIGSVNDQVVPLYSALFAGVEHPAILRSLFIDGEAFEASDFLSNLVVFAARLKNANLSDHDLLFHLSEGLAGALTGVGHSKIYDEAAVYDLAVRYAFETTSIHEPPTSLSAATPLPPLNLSFNPRERRNPYLLTWSLRGIVEDPRIQELFSEELLALREAFETWRPSTKVLKDTKLKLEGIRMLARPAGKL